jgi:ribonuclease-3
MSALANGLGELQEALRYSFRDHDLLRRALTHKSFTNERRELPSPNNERLEFLGDTVLGFVVGDLIYRNFPNLQEGALSKIKAHLVSSATLSTKARELSLGRYLRMGTGEARSGGGEKLSLLADGFEAIVAAIYLDGGLPAAGQFIQRIFAPDIAGIDLADLSFHDYKTALQESAQALGLPLPDYRIVDEYGPDHEKIFVVEVFWDGATFAIGSGPSKREAQRKAAKEALKKLGRVPQTGDR